VSSRSSIYRRRGAGIVDPTRSLLDARAGGDSGSRTRNLRLAKPALCQLSYIPGREDVSTIRGADRSAGEVVGLSGLEPLTSRLSGARSNHLSYRPTSCDAWLRVGAGPELSSAELQREERIAHESKWPKGHRPRNRTHETRLHARVPGDPTRTKCSKLPRKEVIQPHLPVRLPCYDLAPITGLTLGA
jgi:hypothetical protein